MLAPYNENPWSEWLETWQNSSSRQSCFFGFKRSSVRGTGHHFELLSSLHICGTDAATQFKFYAERIKGGYCGGNAAGVREYNSLWKMYHPHLQMKTWNGISVTLRTTVGTQCDVIQSICCLSSRRGFASPQKLTSIRGQEIMRINYLSHGVL